MPKKLSKPGHNPLNSISTTASTTSHTTSSSTSSAGAIGTSSNLSIPSGLSSLPQTVAAAGPSSSSLLPSILTDDQPLPRLVVFDLDYTLWPFWVDTHVTPPLKATPGSNGAAATDKIGDSYGFYADVPRVLHALRAAGVRVGVASRTHTPDLARELLKLLQVPPASSALAAAAVGGEGGWDGEEGGAGGGGSKKKEKARRALDLFDGGLEIYPGSKIRHMEQLSKRAGVPYQEILFFDDETRNRDTESLGVTMWLVRDGVTWGEVESGIKEWRTRRAKR